MPRVPPNQSHQCSIVSAGSGGQWGANCSTAGVYAACVKLREAVAGKLGFSAADTEFSDGLVRAGGRSAPLGQAAAAGEIVAEDIMEFGDLDKKFQQSTFAAHFVEVGVDIVTGETRVRRGDRQCGLQRERHSGARLPLTPDKLLAKIPALP